MKKATRIISRLLKIGTLLSTIALVLSVLVQIYARFFTDTAPSWTEEASRLFFIYAICFAAGPAYKQRYFVSLDLITGRLNEKGNLWLETFVTSLVFLLFLVVAIFSISYIRLGHIEKSPSLGFNMSTGFASILLMSVSVCFFSFMNISRLIKKLQ
ncbi:MAG: TRAP transporter small permease [Cytophagales bacterium]|nr:TRAP transporter small permease [Cytophagales bacterium]